MAEQTGRVTPKEIELLDRFATEHPDRTAPLETALQEPWRGGPGPASWYEFQDQPRQSDSMDSGITGESEARLAKNLAAWFTPDGMNQSAVSRYLERRAVVRTLVDIAPTDQAFSMAERDALQDAAAKLIDTKEPLVSQMSWQIDWQQIRDDKLPESRFAKDLGDLQDVVPAFSPTGLATGRATEALEAVAPQMRTQEGVNLWNALGQVVADVEEGMRVADDGGKVAFIADQSVVDPNIYTRGYRKYGPFKEALAHGNTNMVGMFLSLDALDRHESRREKAAAKDQTARPGPGGR
ncbi:MAG: hypothetical protein KI792_08730 [Alphaproteobacteria bacterium]|nr:hypothetical protein [Alphaproteobacteria bacterium SS10]